MSCDELRWTLAVSGVVVLLFGWIWWRGVPGGVARHADACAEPAARRRRQCWPPAGVPYGRLGRVPPVTITADVPDNAYVPLRTPHPADVEGCTLRDVGSWGLVGAAFVSTWNGLHLGGLKPVDIFLAVVAVCLAYKVLATVRLPPVPGWVVIGTVAVVVVACAHVLLPTGAHFLSTRVRIGSLNSLTGAVESSSAAVQAAKWITALLVVPWFLIIVAERREQILVKVMVAWSAGAAVSAAVSVSDFTGTTSVGATLLGFVSQSGRQSGLASHPNHLGIACALAVPIALYVLSKRRLLGGGLVILLSLGVLLSGSRGAQAVYVIAVLFTLALVRQGSKAKTRLLVVLGLGAATIPFLFETEIAQGRDTLLRFGHSSGAHESDYERRLVAAQAWLDWQERPLVGIGLDYITFAHSIPLQIISAGGVVLAAGMLFYFGGAIGAAWRLRGDSNPLPGYLLVSLIAWFAVGMVENQLTDRYLYFPVGCIAAVQMLRQWQRGNDQEVRLRAPTDDEAAEIETEHAHEPRARARTGEGSADLDFSPG